MIIEKVKYFDIAEAGAALYAEVAAMHGINADVNAGELLYGKYYDPFMCQDTLGESLIHHCFNVAILAMHLENYYDGGLDDAGVSVSWQWEMLSGFLDDGVDDPPYDPGMMESVLYSPPQRSVPLQKHGSFIDLDGDFVAVWGVEWERYQILSPKFRQICIFWLVELHKRPWTQGDE